MLDLKTERLALHYTDFSISDSNWIFLALRNRDQSATTATGFCIYCLR